MIIYKITNKINGKIYIGKTSGLLSRRISSHKSESSKKVFRSNQPIHKAIRTQVQFTYQLEAGDRLDFRISALRKSCDIRNVE